MTPLDWRRRDIVTSKLDPKTVPQQRPDNAPPQPPQN
jgi:hypothetical protein